MLRLTMFGRLPRTTLVVVIPSSWRHGSKVQNPKTLQLEGEEMLLRKRTASPVEKDQNWEVEMTFAIVI